MARPRKSGLAFFYRDVYTWNDYRIMDLVAEYGPIGYAVYDIVLCEVYKNGYYLEIPLEKFAAYIVRMIGNRWIKGKDFALQVIQYCADIGLLDNALLSQSVITSVEIQQHYSEVTARSKADKSKYWLLEKAKKNDSPAVVISAPDKEVFAEETRVFAAKTPVNSEDIPQSKANKNKVNKSKAAAADTNSAGCIEDAYLDATGRRLGTTDYRAVRELKESGVSDAMVADVIRDIGRRGAKIHSFAYFIPAIREAARKNTDNGLYPETASPEYTETVLDQEYLDFLEAIPEEGDYDYDDE